MFDVILYKLNYISGDTVKVGGVSSPVIPPNGTRLIVPNEDGEDKNFIVSRVLNMKFRAVDGSLYEVALLVTEVGW